jgi:hypothetical protein
MSLTARCGKMRRIAETQADSARTYGVDATTGLPL